MGRFLLLLLFSAALFQGGECQLSFLTDFIQSIINSLTNFGTAPATTTTTTTTTTTRPTATTTTTTTPQQNGTIAPWSGRCGDSFRNQPRIVGGAISAYGSWPWQAALLVQYNGSINALFCGGSLISKRHVVTAAHCTNGRTTSNTFVKLGVTDFYGDQSAVQNFRLSAIRQHQSYNSQTYLNDISILLLATPAVLNARVSPICLPPPILDFSNTNATVSGWGTTSEGGSVSAQLRDVSVPVLTNSRCLVSYPNQIAASMLCAGITGKDSCQGDSGGPLEEQIWSNTSWALIGVVSWGYGCARDGYPGVYTRVNSFLDWIAANAPASEAV